jgi:signal transduction histidine kinase
MIRSFVHRTQEFLRRIDDDELQGLHHHTLRGIRAMAVCLGALAPCGPLFVLVEDVHRSRALVALALHLGYYALLSLLAKRQFGWRHTNVLILLLAAGMAVDMSLGAQWLLREPHSGGLLFATLIPMVIGVFVPWKPLLTITLAIPALVAIHASHYLLGLPLPISGTSLANAAFSLGIASAVAIQAQRRLWWRFELASKQLEAAEREANAKSAEASQRAADIRRILDNVDEGFVRVTLDGRMSKERSAVLEQWFGVVADNAKFVDHVRRVDPAGAEAFALNWEQLRDDFLPVELVLDQMPRRIRAGAKTLALRYQPVLDGETLTEVVLVVSDVSAEVARELAEAELRNLLGALKHILLDRDGFIQFVREASTLVDLIAHATFTGPELLRQIHTLKGNASLFEITSVSRLCHELESRLLADGSALSALESRALLDAWEPIARLAGQQSDANCGASRLDVAESEHGEVIGMLLDGVPRAEVVQRLQRWKLEPSRRRLQRLAEGARATALRLEKGAIDVSIEDGGVRLPERAWAPFWTTLVHLLRNALDHGLESPEERALSGKPGRGQLRLRTAIEAGELVIEIGDDGRGIDWDALRAKAAESGLAHVTRDDMVAALFADGISSRRFTTEDSGRGVGMGAVRRACTELGGTIEVASAPGEGTRFTMRFSSVNPPPRAGEARAERPSAFALRSLRAP